MSSEQDTSSNDGSGRSDTLHSSADQEENLNQWDVLKVPTNSTVRLECSSCCLIQCLKEYARSPEPELLDCAIWNGELAIKWGTDKDYVFHNFAIALGKRYKISANVNDLHKAVKMAERAMEKNPGEITFTYNLVMLLLKRYQRSGNLEDLTRATLCTNDVLAPLKGGRSWIQRLIIPNSLWAAHLQNSGICLLEDYWRDGPHQEKTLSGAEKKQVICKAVNVNEKALAYASKGDPEYPQFQQNLATSLRERYTYSQNLNDLHTALDHDHTASLKKPGDAAYMQNLALSYKALYDITGREEHLKEALKSIQNAVECTKECHPQYRHYNHIWAVLEVVRYKTSASKTEEDLKFVCTKYKDSFLQSSGTGDFYPIWSWHAAHHWASLEDKKKDHQLRKAYATAFDLLPHILDIEDPFHIRLDAHRNIDITGATSNAIAACVAHNDLPLGIQVAEKGLMVLFRKQWPVKKEHDYTSGVDQFQKRLADLFSESKPQKEFLNEISAPKIFSPPELDDILSKVGERGPVVILNSHSESCHAIILCQSSQVKIELDHTLDELQAQKNTLKKLLADIGNDSRISAGQKGALKSQHTIEKGFKDLLDWLWKRMKFKSGRLWWCPIGLFTGLPLHAACTSDEIIQSYTPSLGVLIDARYKAGGSPDKICVICVTNVKGHSLELPCVQSEGEIIESIFGKSKTKTLVGQKANLEKVKKELKKKSPWLHFACHALQDADNAGQSFLQLYDGHLSLQDTIQLELSNPQFVFLAACQTAKGDAALVNESLHLSGGFIAAGFKAAVGTMWTMDDEDGPKMAKAFYSHLFSEGRVPDVTDTAEALHTAVKKLKKLGVPCQQWIPFVHFGV